MPNWLQHIADPGRLVLAWQADDRFRVRFRWAVAELRRAGEEDCDLRYLATPDEFEQANSGRSYAEILDLGYRGYPGFKVSEGAHRTGVLPALMRRLPLRGRADFNQYLAHFRIPPERATISDFALLAATEAKLPNDGFSVVDPLSPHSTPVDLMMEIAGFRYYARDLPSKPMVGQALDIRAEPENEHDRNAVMFLAAGHKVGNVNRMQTGAFLQWIRDAEVTATVERVNGSSDRPRVYAFITVRSR